MVQALEELEVNSSKAQLNRAKQLLIQAAQLYSESEEIWYLRYLVETKLGEAPLAEFALREAKRWESEPLTDSINPFQLATPDSRGIIASTSLTPIPTSLPKRTTPRKFALVIGVGQFQDTGIRELRYTTADADAFSNALTDPRVGGFKAEDVHVLTDQNATTENIKFQLHEIARIAQPNDLVVVYVATHGTPHKLDTVRGVSYLLTYDTQLYEDGNPDESRMASSAYSMVELADMVASGMKSLRTLVVIDACYSAGAFDGVRTSDAHAVSGPTPEMLDRMSRGTGRIILAASQADETSLESPSLGHGNFTFDLLAALKKSNGRKPIGELFTGVAESVAKRADAVGSHQHPVIFRSSRNDDFALSGPPAS
jgi:hypothetical protein